MKIIYTNSNNQVSVITPAITDIPIFQLAEKDVPASIKFWIVEDSYIPSDRTYRSAWKLENMPVPSGVGLTKAEYIAKYPNFTNHGVNE